MFHQVLMLLRLDSLKNPMAVQSPSLCGCFIMWKIIAFYIPLVTKNNSRFRQYNILVSKLFVSRVWVQQKAKNKINYKSKQYLKIGLPDRPNAPSFFNTKCDYFMLQGFISPLLTEPSWYVTTFSYG